MTPSWRGHLRLSLVTCPVILYNAISPAGEVHFRLINPVTGNRIRMVTVDSETEEPLQRRDLLRGFEVAKGQYVTLTPDEIGAVRLESTKTIEINAFAPARDIDRLYWDKPYYLVPDGDLAVEPFAVIRAAMERSGQVALGRVVMSERERLLALEARDRGIVATTLRSHGEVRDATAFFADIPDTRVPAEMISIAEKIIQQKAKPFDPETFQDRYEEALKDLIEQKRQGGRIVAATAPETPANVIDLMEALRGSLREGNPKTPTRRRAPSPRKAPPKRATRSRAKR